MRALRFSSTLGFSIEEEIDEENVADFNIFDSISEVEKEGKVINTFEDKDSE